MSNTTTNTNENNVSNEDIQKSVSSVNLTNNGFFIGVAIFYISMISYYFLVKEIINDDNKTLYYKILAGYTLIISTILFFINYTTVYNKCGESQLGTAFLSTYLPWIIIFGSICVIIEIIPEFKTPFSNTIGYIIYNNDDTKKLINEIFANSPEDSSKIILKFKSNPTLILNEITNKTFENFITDIQSITTVNEDNKTDLLKIVKQKEFISTIVWYLLTGTLVTTYSSNIIATSQCNIKYKN